MALDDAERDEIDLDRLLEDAHAAEAEAQAALEMLAGVEPEARPEGRAPLVRTLQERRQAVIETVEAATPERRVRTPAERAEAVRRVLEERERLRHRRVRSEQERRQSAAEVIPARPPPRDVRTPEQREADHGAAPAATTRERRPRSYAERLDDARRAALDELERRRAEVAELNRRLLQRRAVRDGDHAS